VTGGMGGHLKFYFFDFFHVETHQACKVIQLSIPSFLEMPAKSKLEILLKWFNENEIEWEKDLLEVKDTNYCLGVFAKADIEEGRPGKLISVLTETALKWQPLI
jgi:hypothetical protein